MLFITRPSRSVILAAECIGVNGANWPGLLACMSRRQCRSGHIAKFFCNAELGRYRSTADIEQATPIKLDFIKYAPLSKGLRLLLGAQTVGVQIQNDPIQFG